jgi:proline iminopeptidase
MPIRPAALALILLTLSNLTGCGTPTVPISEGVLPVSGGDELWYRIYGAGPDTLVFLHGGPALSSRYLEQAFAPLARRGRTLLFFDARGRGRSPVVHALDSLRLDVDVADLDAVRRHFGLGAMTLVGHQWGTAVLLKYWLRYPAQVKRAVLLTPFPHKGDFVWELQYLPNDSAAHRRHGAARAAGRDTADPAGYCRAFWGFAFSPVEEVRPAVVRRLAPVVCDASPDRLRQREAIQHRLYLTFGTWDWRDSIRSLRVPTLVVAGAGEPALVAGARAWAGRLPKARLLVVGQTPLFPWLEAGPAIRDAIDEFTGGAWPAAGLVVSAPPDPVIGS